MKARCVAIIILLSFIQLIPVGYAVDIPQYHKTIEGSSLRFKQLVPYPDFSNMPNITETGASNQFSSTHSNDELNLTWTHEAGNRLDYREVPDEDLPDCKEFIYFTQDMIWPIENYPLEKNLTVNFYVTLEGSFHDEPLGPRMFTIYGWIIDSSGDWIQIYKSSPPYNTQNWRQIQISDFEAERIWGGMLADAAGDQEDPSDTFQIAFGLAPSLSMENDFYGDPWQFYNGSVNLIFSGLSFEVLYVDDAQISPIFTPTHSGNVTLDTTYMEEDMTYDDTGNVYTLGNVRDYSAYNYSQLIIKWDSNADLQWIRLWNGTQYAQGQAITYYQSGLYVVGYVMDKNFNRDFSITKRNQDGNLIWEKTWDGGNTWSMLESFLTKHRSEWEIGNHSISSDNGLRLAISNNGDILALVDSHFMVDMSTENQSMSWDWDVLSLLVYSTDGDLKRQMVVDVASSGFIWDEYCELQVSNDYIYTQGFNLTKVDNDYNKIWSEWGFSNFVVNNDDEFAGSWTSDSWSLAGYDVDPSYVYAYNLTWSWDATVDLNDSYWLPNYNLNPILFTDNDSVMFLSELTYQQPDQYIHNDYYRYSELYFGEFYPSNGASWVSRIELNNLIPDSLMYGFVNLRYINSSNHILIAVRTYDGLSLLIYNNGDTPTIAFDTGIVIYGISAAIIGLVAIDYLRRQRMSNSS